MNTAVISAIVEFCKKAPAISTSALQAEAEVALNSLLTKAVIGDIVDYSADGAISVSDSVAKISKGSAAAMTLAAPTAEGHRLTICSTSAFAHVITTVDLINDGVTGGAKDIITLGAFVGASIELIAINSKWTVVSKNVAVIS